MKSGNAFGAERGSVLLAMLIMLIVFAISAVFILGQSNTQLKNASNMAQRTKAYYDADAGIQDALVNLRNPAWYVGVTSTTLTGAGGYVPPGGMASGFQLDNCRYMIRRGASDNADADTLPDGLTDPFADGIQREIYIVTSQGLNGAQKPVITLQAVVLRWQKPVTVWNTSIISRRERKG